MMTWANWEVGQTKLRHPDVWGVTDVGRKLGGRFGEEFLSIAFLLCECCGPAVTMRRDQEITHTTRRDWTVFLIAIGGWRQRRAPFGVARHLGHPASPTAWPQR